MGRMQAQGMAETGMAQDAWLAWHLTANHYPPVPVEFVPAAAEAISLFKLCLLTQISKGNCPLILNRFSKLPH